MFHAPPAQGAGLLAEGSELLLEIVNPGIIGGVVLPVLGALPDSLIILTSLSSASQAEAQEAIAVGIGEREGGKRQQGQRRVARRTGGCVGRCI